MKYTFALIRSKLKDKLDLRSISTILKYTALYHTVSEVAQVVIKYWDWTEVQYIQKYCPDSCLPYMVFNLVCIICRAISTDHPH